MVRPQERHLHGILGPAGVDDPFGDAQQARAMEAHELLEGQLVAGRHPSDQGPVAHLVIGDGYRRDEPRDARDGVIVIERLVHERTRPQRARPFQGIGAARARHET